MSRNGASQPKLVELRLHSYKQYMNRTGPEVKEKYSVQWRKPLIDVAELVTKRYLEGWQIEKLCQHFGKCRNTIQWIYLDLKKKEFIHKSIPPELRQKLLKATKNEDWMKIVQSNNRSLIH